jgi:hypothetical protein
MFLPNTFSSCREPCPVPMKMRGSAGSQSGWSVPSFQFNLDHFAVGIEAGIPQTQ